MKTISRFLSVIILSTFLLPAMSDAQIKLPFGKKNKVATGESLELTQRSGPWLIMCTSFVGEQRVEQARRLALELRQEHRLNAYVYQHKFDFAEDVASRGIGWEVVKTADNGRDVRPIQMKLAKESTIEEVAVVVGDFASVDDSRAQKTLKKIKTLNPQSMSGVNVSSGFLGAPTKFGATASSPLGAAFLLPNPSLPDEYFQKSEVDDFVMKLNKRSEVENSLLKNPGIYTVKVASFLGETSIDQQEIAEKNREHQWRIRDRKGVANSKLMDAAKKATLLARELRSKGLEAYEFHDRHESIVCVGSFDWIAQQDAGGTKRQNPDVVNLILEFKGKIQPLPGKPNGVQTYTLSKRLTDAGISCDPQPIPVLVPKAQTTTANRFFNRFK